MNPAEPAFLFEPITLVAPLGLVFWDSVTASRVDSGLRVAARPAGTSGPTVLATVSPSGIWGFTHLPGLRHLENGAGDAAYWAGITPGMRRNYQIDVTDPAGRFLPCVVASDAPRRGVGATPCTQLVVQPAHPPGAIPLFSSPARSAPADRAQVRVEVTSQGKPGSWAILQARSNNLTLGYGLADARGQCLLAFPYPSTFRAEPIWEQKWSLVVRCFYAVKDSLPDYCTLLQQPQVGEQTVELVFGQPLNIKFDIA